MKAPLVSKCYQCVTPPVTTDLITRITDWFEYPEDEGESYGDVEITFLLIRLNFISTGRDVEI